MLSFIIYYAVITDSKERYPKDNACAASNFGYYGTINAVCISRFPLTFRMSLASKCLKDNQTNRVKNEFSHRTS